MEEFDNARAKLAEDLVTKGAGSNIFISFPAIPP
jgi:hypothetical protein